MMARAYELPVSDDSTLYLANDSASVKTLLEMAALHFSVDTVDTDDFIIEAENVKVTGCACCYDSSDYVLYLVIKRR